MRVMIENKNPQPTSCYLKAGAPKCCSLPSCRKPFGNSCLHAQDGHYYCSPECVDRTRKVDLAQVLGFRRTG